MTFREHEIGAAGRQKRPPQRTLGFLYRARLPACSCLIDPMTPKSDGGGSRFEPPAVSFFAFARIFSKRRSAARHAVLELGFCATSNKTPMSPHTVLCACILMYLFPIAALHPFTALVPHQSTGQQPIAKNRRSFSNITCAVTPSASKRKHLQLPLPL